MRKCRKCNLFKSQSDFNKGHNKNTCKKCENAYRRGWNAKRKVRISWMDKDSIQVFGTAMPKKPGNWINLADVFGGNDV